MSDNNLALFCDFENVALGVKDEKLPPFDVELVLERLLVKGNVVVKKAYCDWSRYKDFKPSMHEASFELIEIPHTRQSGKNSADIRMVVDALDLCYTKHHLDTFVIISGDSDFSPLVSKLRENAKVVIGVGVRSSTSDLLMSNCDEFIFYNDLVKRAPAKKPRKTATSKKSVKEDGVKLVLNTAKALIEERGDRVFGSMVKQTLKRRNPGFNEGALGFSSFNELLEDAAAQGLLDIELDERSGGYVVRSVKND
jgi:uncharacterized protein (TIGR00288 family)